LQPYERFLLQCPHCGTGYVPTGRTTPDEVEGDLIELDPEVLKALRKEIAKVDGPCYPPKDVSAPTRSAIMRNHTNRQIAQKALRDVMNLWAGWRNHCGESDREAQKRFYLTFATDTATAQSLGVTDAEALQARIQAELDRNHIVRAAA